MPNLSLSVKVGFIRLLIDALLPPVFGGEILLLKERFLALLKLRLIVVSWSRSSSLAGLGTGIVSRTSTPAPHAALGKAGWLS